LSGDFLKLVEELTPCGHRSEKNSISTAKATIILFVGLRIIFLNMRCRRWQNKNKNNWTYGFYLLQNFPIRLDISIDP
jgi:hypothetical protein